jgi:hypothetical protein
VPAGARPFTYHRRNAFAAILIALAAMSVVELFAVHLVVHVRAPRAAWALTAVSLFGVVWIVGFLRAVLLRPVLVTADALEVRTGVQWRLVVPRSAIVAVETGYPKVPRKGTPGWLRAVAIGQPNVVVRLSAPLVAGGPYGIRRTVSHVALAVDEPAALAAALRSPPRA